MENRWIIEPQPNFEDIQRLHEEINVPEALAVVLLQRGISNFDQAKSYFRPSLDDLIDPFLMKDMDLAVAFKMQSTITKTF